MSCFYRFMKDFAIFHRDLDYFQAFYKVLCLALGFVYVAH